MGIDVGVDGAAEGALLSVLSAAGAGLVLSLFIEGLMLPRLDMKRPWSAWCLHAGLWLLPFSVLVLILGRPWFSAAAVSAFLLMLVLVNNAKVRALREPFVFQDYEYYTDAIRHPRLYIPFLGWWKFLGATAGFVSAVAIGLWWETVPATPLEWNGQLAAVASTAAFAGLLLLVQKSSTLPVSFDPERDVRAYGFLALLWLYGWAGRALPTAKSPFTVQVARESIQARGVQGTSPDRKAIDPRAVVVLPHLIAVQSESFFDARRLFSGVRKDVLAEFDRLRDDALMHGKLNVPAWGANTVRTEFAFLSGIEAGELGVHRFNPYRAIAAGWDLPSLATLLKALGYRTVCIHPYPASFYLRDRVYPKLGFDEFLDIRAFEGAGRSGPYIADAAVADKVTSILDAASGPVFIFVITMENHGPLHLEHVATGDVQDLYTSPPPEGCEDLTIYLRHLRNADRMVAQLRSTLERSSRPAGLCWFGDHVPIMPTVYQTFGSPEGQVEYVFWRNVEGIAPSELDLPAHRLAPEWLSAMGVISPNE